MPRDDRPVVEPSPPNPPAAPLRRRLQLNTIGVRLTLWGAAVTLAVCVLLAVALYAGFRVSIYGEIDGFLEGEVHEFAALLDAQTAGDLREIEQTIRLELQSRVRHDLLFRLLDLDGAVVLNSETADPLPAPWPVDRHPPPSKRAASFETYTPPGAAVPLRICTIRLERPDGTRFLAQTAYLMDRVTASLSLFRRIAAGSLVLAAVVALVAGRVLARRSLAPVADLTEQARRYEPSHLDQRLPRTQNGDELDRLADTLNAMLDRVASHVARLQQFTADASHELRSPLAALRGTAEVALSRKRSNEELRRVIEDSVEHYDRLTHIAEDLLLLARADAGVHILQTQRIRLHEALDDVVDLYAPLAQERQIDLSYEPRMPLDAEADGGRLRQLVGNLLDNAIKYTEPGGRVRLGLERNGDRAVIVVADNGGGIATEDLPRIFDRFYRADRARSTVRTRGAGLGLAICRSITQAHGGTIEIESTPKSGTTVTVELPALPAEH